MRIQPTESEYSEPAVRGRRNSQVRRARGVLALVALVAVVVGGSFGVARLVVEADRGASADQVSDAPTVLAASEDRLLEVSGSGVGAQPFGTGADDVMVALTARLGEPDLRLGPRRYFRIPGQDAWLEDADDPLSLSWQYPVASVSCWGTLCVIFGGDGPRTLRLRGWEVAQYRRWSESPETRDLQSPDVRLALTFIRLGDSWKRLHAAYPGTVAGGAEGASLAVHDTPWAGVSDGVAGWRLSGQWDFSRPTEAPSDSLVTRLSGGEGPQPGCC